MLDQFAEILLLTRKDSQIQISSIHRRCLINQLLLSIYWNEHTILFWISLINQRWNIYSLRSWDPVTVKSEMLPSLLRLLPWLLACFASCLVHPAPGPWLVLVSSLLESATGRLKHRDGCALAACSIAARPSPTVHERSRTSRVAA